MSAYKITSLARLARDGRGGKNWTACLGILHCNVLFSILFFRGDEVACSALAAGLLTGMGGIFHSRQDQTDPLPVRALA